jgi:uncharacterized protein
MNYHMRRKDRQITDPAVLDQIISKGQFAVLALCRENEPYCVTLSYGYDPSEKSLYFHAAKIGLKLDFLRANSRVCLTIIEDNGYIKTVCSHAYRTVVVRGTMELLEIEEEKVKAIMTMIRQYEENSEKQIAKISPQNAEWNNTQMLRLRIEEITGKERSVPSKVKP